MSDVFLLLKSMIYCLFYSTGSAKMYKYQVNLENVGSGSWGTSDISRWSQTPSTDHRIWGDAGVDVLINIAHTLSAINCSTTPTHGETCNASARKGHGEP